MYLGWVCLSVAYSVEIDIETNLRLAHILHIADSGINFQTTLFTRFLTRIFYLISTDRLWLDLTFCDIEWVFQTWKVKTVLDGFIYHFALLLDLWDLLCKLSLFRWDGEKYVDVPDFVLLGNRLSLFVQQDIFLFLPQSVFAFLDEIAVVRFFRSFFLH